MIDEETVRVAALNNRVPYAVLVIEIVGAAVGLGLLALYLAILSRGVVTVILAAAFVSVLLLITFDLDRPTRGVVTVPDTPLVSLRASMELPPAAQPPSDPQPEERSAALTARRPSRRRPRGCRQSSGDPCPCRSGASSTRRCRCR
jgi:hypothetical protein